MQPFNFWIPSYQSFYNSPIRNPRNSKARDGQINQGIARSVWGYAGFENAQALTNNQPSLILGVRARMNPNARLGIGEQDSVVMLNRK